MSPWGNRERLAWVIEKKILKVFLFLSKTIPKPNICMQIFKVSVLLNFMYFHYDTYPALVI